MLKNSGRVLFVGHCYYYPWYLSRELRKLGWKADVLNIDPNNENKDYYHEEDYKFYYRNKKDIKDQLKYYFNSIINYDIFHFSNAHGLYFINNFDYYIKNNIIPVMPKKNNIFKKIFDLLDFKKVYKYIIYFLSKILKYKENRIYRFIFLINYKYVKKIDYNILLKVIQYSNEYEIHNLVFSMGMDAIEKLILECAEGLPERWDIKLLKILGKKIIYTNNGCLDGVAQSSFRKWGPYPVCDICKWRDNPDVCSDEKNLAWGKLRNNLADYQCTIGANRADYNDDPKVHEVPEFYCLDKNIWNPDLLIPANYLLPFSKDTIKIYHAIGNYSSRTDAKNNQNIKCTHIYLPLIEKFKKEGYKIELIFFHDVPNKKLRYYQLQADIVVDMLTFGYFGANVREAMMLGKPVICYLRPEWLETIRKERPQYIKELPVISATPDNIYDILKELLDNPEKRNEIGRRSREFAVKWHSSESAALKFDQIYSNLLKK